MIHFAAAVFVKTPGLSPIKTRLAKDIGKLQAERFHIWSAKKTETAVKKGRALLASGGISLTGFWAVAEPGGESFSEWGTMPYVSQGEGALGDRLFNVYSVLMERYDAVFLLGADSPELTEYHVNRACLALLKDGGKSPLRLQNNFVLGPSEDGGFYLLGGSQKVDRELWKGIPYSDPNTGAEIVRTLQLVGPVTKIDQLIDVDDLDSMRKIGLDRFFLH